MSVGVNVSLRAFLSPLSLFALLVEMRPEESLARLEDHLVVYFEELVDEEPGAVRAQLRAVTVLKNPVPLLKGDAIEY